MVSTNNNFSELAHWRRAIVFVLLPFLLPALLLVVLLLSTVALWNWFAYGVCWLRWKLIGVPIPPMGPAATTGDEAESMQTQEGGGAEP